MLKEQEVSVLFCKISHNLTFSILKKNNNF
jgi:hypothetical protein